MDSLDSLKLCILEKKKIQWSDDRKTIYLDGVPHPAKEETAWRSKMGKGPLYPLDSIIFFYQNRNLLGQYIKECITRKLTRVEIQDRQALIKYLEGVTNEGFIDMTVRASHIDIVQPKPQVESKIKDEDITLAMAEAMKKEDDIVNFKQKEKKIHSFGSILKSRSRNFRSIINVADNAWKDVQMSATSNKRSQNFPHSVSNKKLVNSPPIILVPFPITSLINIYNAKEFLQKGVYLLPLEQKSTLDKQDLPRSTRVLIERASFHDDTVSSTYIVTDRPDLLTSSDWKRVACVFAQGVQWQFKQYLWKEPAELFSKVCGFYLYFDDEHPPEIVNQWRVHKLKISKNRRYLDRAIVFEFWDTLHVFLSSHRPDLII